MNEQIKNKIRKAVFIIIYFKEKKQIEYLILKRKLHWKGWEFPKGGIKRKEKINSAILRETKEETGQIPKNIHKYFVFGRYKYPKEYKDRKGIFGQSYSLFSAEINSKKIKIDKLEHLDYKFISYENALKYLTWPNQRKCLKIVNKRLKNGIRKV